MMIALSWDVFWTGRISNRSVAAPMSMPLASAAANPSQ